MKVQAPMAAAGAPRLLRGRVTRAFGLRLVLVGVNLATAVILARLLGPERYGIYVFAISVLAIVALPGQAGVPLVMVREVAFRMSDGDPAGARAVSLRLGRLVLGYGALVGAGVAGFAGVSGVLHGEEQQVFLWVGALLPAFILLPAIGAGLRARDHLVAGQGVETLLRPTIFLALLAAALALGRAPDAGQAMALHALGAGLGAAAAMALQRRLMPPDATPAAPPPAIGPLLASVAPFTVIAGVQLILAKTDIVMLRALLGPVEVGHYQVALQWANLALIAHQAVLMVTGPSIARTHRAGDRAGLQEVLTLAARLVLLGAVPVVMVLALAGPSLIAASFGAAFAPAYGALCVLLAGRLTIASFGAVVQLARMLGWERPMVALIGAAALLNLGLNAALIPGYGIIGAAIASITADLAWKTALVGLAWRRLGLVSFPVGGRGAAGEVG